MSQKDGEDYKHMLRLEYMNAYLQRVKKMPKIEELTGDPIKGTSLKKIQKILESKPTFKKV